MFLEISQISEDNICARLSLLIKLQASAFNFIKKGSPVQVFSCEFWEISKNTSGGCFCIYFWHASGSSTCNNKANGNNWKEKNLKNVKCKKNKNRRLNRWKISGIVENHLLACAVRFCYCLFVCFFFPAFLLICCFLQSSVETWQTFRLACLFIFFY